MVEELKEAVISNLELLAIQNQIEIKLLTNQSFLGL